MLTTITAIEFVRKATNGRTEPLVLTCERADGSTVDVMAKFSKGCDQGVINLSREVIAACLAADLGLPIPEAFLVEIPPDFADAVPDVDAQAKIKASSHFAFGSHLMKAQFSTWASSSTISAIMLPMAAAIFVFDAIIQNPDRRGTNPNCLIRGNDLRIFDHELAFAHEIIIGWRPPWVAGGLNTLERPGNHIFRNGLRRQAIDYGPIRDAWQGLSDEQIVAYEGICPEEWADANAAITAAVALIRDAHDHIDGCLTEVKRVML